MEKNEEQGKLWEKFRESDTAYIAAASQKRESYVRLQAAKRVHEADCEAFEKALKASTEAAEAFNESMRKKEK